MTALFCFTARIALIGGAAVDLQHPFQVVGAEGTVADNAQSQRQANDPASPSPGQPAAAASPTASYYLPPPEFQRPRVLLGLEECNSIAFCRSMTGLACHACSCCLLPSPRAFA